MMGFLMIFSVIFAIFTQFSTHVLPGSAPIPDVAPIFDAMSSMEITNENAPADQKIAASYASVKTRSATQTNTTSGRYITLVGGSFAISNASILDGKLEDAGTAVKSYEKLLYAHSTAAFNGLKRMHEGSTFSVTENGVTTNYRIELVHTFDANLSDSSGNYTVAIYYSASYRSYGEHDLALMTCGNGSNNDSSLRTVYFANKI